MLNLTNREIWNNVTAVRIWSIALNTALSPKYVLCVLSSTGPTPALKKDSSLLATCCKFSAVHAASCSLCPVKSENKTKLPQPTFILNKFTLITSVHRKKIHGENIWITVTNLVNSLPHHEKTIIVTLIIKPSNTHIPHESFLLAFQELIAII